MSKKEDLRFFLKEICQMDYLHQPLLAPTAEMLDTYKKLKGQWSDYEREFLRLMQSREIESKVLRDQIADGCLLCSEETPDHCHRRLVAEYLRDKWIGLEIVHIV
jgi:uncharacterized protein YeaO (DUF488 family)